MNGITFYEVVVFYASISNSFGDSLKIICNSFKLFPSLANVLFRSTVRCYQVEKAKAIIATASAPSLPA